MMNRTRAHRLIKSNITWYSFLFPSLLALFLFVYKPMFTTLLYSFTNMKLFNSDGAEWIGLANYSMLLTNSTFLKVIWNTIALALYGLLTIPLGFLLANAINSLGRGKLQAFFRVAFYLPNIITGVSVVLVFVCVLKSKDGLLNQALSLIAGHKVTISWLGDYRISHIGASIIYIWQNLGYTMLMCLANLQSISSELYEAADIDGANRFQSLLYITIPSMRPCFSFLLITTMISGLSRFTDLFVIGGNSVAGQPNQTLQTIMMYIYQYSFETPEFGISSAGAVILFLFVLAFTLVDLKISNFLKEE